MKEKMPLRQCVVTGKFLPKSDLMRFVMAPDGNVILDLKENLPGNVVYIQPMVDFFSQLTLEKLTEKMKKPASPILTLESLREIIQNDVVARLQLTKKANGLVIGADEVQKASGEIEALFVAKDAGKNAFAIVDRLGARGVPVVSIFSKARLSAALSVPNCALVGVTTLDILRQNLHKYEDFLAQE